MISVLILLLLTLLQFITGAGVVLLCRLSVKPGLFVPLALLSGIAVFSVIPFLLQLLYIPITAFSVFLSLVIACCLLNIKVKKNSASLKLLFSNTRFSLKIYELPCLLVIGFILCISVWRCFYFPPTPRDFTSGAEVIAEYAVREQTMINSVFTVNLESTNNPFKSPFLISLQVIYKLAGFHFGQLWLSTIFISCILFLYHALRKTLHSLIAGILIVFFLAIPEMYAYTFMGLYDYSNAVYFFLAFYFLFEYFDSRNTGQIVFAGILFGIATYIRSETLLLGCLALPLPAWLGFKQKSNIADAVKACLFFIVTALLFYILSVSVYLSYYLPVKYSIAGLVNSHLADLSPLVSRFMQLNGKLIFSGTGITYYGYFIFIFLALLVTELIYKRKISNKAKNWIVVIIAIYLGYPLVGYLLPLLDMDHSTKRGLFKLFPLMLLYMAHNSLLIRLSDRIGQWEHGNKTMLVN
jgi:hypothetical protein